MFMLILTNKKEMKIGIHKQHNRFPLIMRYWRPRNLMLKRDIPIYKWMWFYIQLKHDKAT